jgi:hypothetical protein
LLPRIARAQLSGLLQAVIKNSLIASYLRLS